MKTKSLLKIKGIRPSKFFGQHFLIKKRIIKKILKSAKISKNDVILEIGAGTGNLTRGLTKKAKKVIAVEKDKRMIEILKENIQGFRNIEIVQGDILKIIEKEKLKIDCSYKIVANLPFYLTSFFLRKIFEKPPGNLPSLMILMVQKEVAKRIVAVPPKMNLLALSVQFFSYPQILFYVSKDSFWPKPKVDSAIIKIIPKKENEILKEKEFFFKLVRAGFLHPRKKLLSNLVKGLKLNKELIENIFKNIKINKKARAQELSLKDWISIYNCLKNMVK